MSQFRITIKSIDHVTHDVLRIAAAKPAHLKFAPGQATEIFIDKEPWRKEGRPFTFTSLPSQDYVEFTIKTYPERKGVTNELLHLHAGDELILNDVFGAIAYKGPGLFLAGGAGVTPFICILRDLHARGKLSGNKLIFANKKREDIIHDDEFRKLLGNNFINVLSEEKIPGYEQGFISEELLAKYLPAGKPHIYLCGPPPMMDAMEKLFAKVGIAENQVVKEAF